MRILIHLLFCLEAKLSCLPTFIVVPHTSSYGLADVAAFTLVGVGLVDGMEVAAPIQLAWSVG